eukprot:TRINITY_DN18615_c0_g1_i1.p1 TRINITY_DN18615_c0_g1~~TRINITY_DN18615_c0_g1_i1.p1  ORF type:complete len:659 (+),score=107.11 TRINITY_DN18615_c0_g1_i1:76-2052(+)
MTAVPLPPAVRRKQANQLVKTQLCKFFQIGKCSKGESCSFAHDPAGLRAKPDLECTSMCKTFLASGNCQLPNCRYAHDERELRTTDFFFKTKLCRFAASGRCKHGAACRFAHTETELSFGPSAVQDVGTPRLQAPSAQRVPAPGLTEAQAEVLDQMQQRRLQLQMALDATQARRQIASSLADSNSTSDGTSNRDGGSDQSTRAETSASVPTPEGSGDSSPEEFSNLPAAARRGTGGAEDRNRQRRAGDRANQRHCTTLMLTNVPQFLTQGALVSLLEDLTVYMRGAFDFFYCPWDPCQNCNLGYAIVNFFARSVAAEFETEWSNQPLLPGIHGAKRLRIVPAALQGRAANLRHFSGFSLAHHADARFRPLVRMVPDQQLRPMAIAEEMADARIALSEEGSTDAGGGLQGIAEAELPSRPGTGGRGQTKNSLDPARELSAGQQLAWPPHAQISANVSKKSNQVPMPAMPFPESSSTPSLGQAALAALVASGRSTDSLLSLLASSRGESQQHDAAALLASAAIAELRTREAMQMHRALAEAKAWNESLSGQHARQAALMQQPGLTGSNLASMASIDKQMMDLSDFKVGHGLSPQSASDMAAQPYMTLLMPQAMPSVGISSGIPANQACSQGQLPALAAFMPGMGQLNLQRQQQASGMMLP